MSAFTDLFSAKSLSGILNINMHTLEEYLEFLEAAYLMFPVNHFSYSLKRQITYPRKIYSVDNGIINAVSFRFSENIGKQLENIVFSEIKRSDIECYYWKGKKECDFLLKDRQKNR
jgi:predicted AAA+ superfamily ATPase